jgi:hypothetical protein
MNFNRIATFPICSQLEKDCNVDTETVAEIITASEDGMTLIYSDSQMEAIGFVDITDPSDPQPAGFVQMAGEPTSVTVIGNYAFAAVNTSEDYVNTSGLLVAIDITTKMIVKTWDLGGQPDSVAASPDGKYIIVAIENERDEDLGDGRPPQMPAGYVVIVETADSLDDYQPFVLEMTGLDGLLFPEDPEPEFVHVNKNNIAVMTLQENNGIVLIDLASKTVISSFSAGTVDLVNIDTDGKDGVISQTSSLEDVPREPDGVVFISEHYYVTANEGDMDGGSRGFTVFHTSGEVVYDSGSDMDQITASVGHYPEERSGKKGSEPENVAFGTFDGTDYLFVNVERSNLAFVYDMTDITSPKFKQVLPTTVAPEGSKVITSRNLFVVANEADDRENKIRSSITIYEYAKGHAQYPTIMSKRDKDTGVAIPFSALSGLSPDPTNANILYSVEDSAYESNRFFTINAKKHPAVITKATTIVDTMGVLAAENADMVNADGTVNIDPEGIAADGAGIFYIASEGRGAAGEDDQTLNYIFKVDSAGIIHGVISLPEEINAVQAKYGFEGIAYHPEGYLVVCLQRAWGEFEGPLIGVYDLNEDEWAGYVQYPLDEPESVYGGWVGLSDITYVKDKTFYILERDNQGGPDAAIKRIYSIDLEDLALEGEVIEKTLVADLIGALDFTGGMPQEKIEGLAFTAKGVWIVNDNDGLADNSGEIQLINLGQL